jgi:hypothetical protein
MHFEAEDGERERDDRAHRKRKATMRWFLRKPVLRWRLRILNEMSSLCDRIEKSAFQDEIREGVVLLGMDMPKDFMDIDTHTETTGVSQDELKRNE